MAVEVGAIQKDDIPVANLEFGEDIRVAIPNADMDHKMSRLSDEGHVPTERCVVFGHCTDAIVLVRDGSFSIRVNRPVLAKASPILQNIVKTSKNRRTPIFVTARKDEAVKGVIQWIYTGDIKGEIQPRDMDNGTFIDIIVISEQWGLGELRDLCLTIIREKQTDDQFRQSLHFVLKPNPASNVPQLRLLYAEYLANNAFNLQHHIALGYLASRDREMLQIVADELHKRQMSLDDDIETKKRILFLEDQLQTMLLPNADSYEVLSEKRPWTPDDMEIPNALPDSDLD